MAPPVPGVSGAQLGRGSGDFFGGALVTPGDHPSTFPLMGSHSSLGKNEARAKPRSRSCWESPGARGSRGAVPPSPGYKFSPSPGHRNPDCWSR